MEVEEGRISGSEERRSHTWPKTSEVMNQAQAGDMKYSREETTTGRRYEARI